MATNKNASIRYQVLDRCFSNPGRKYYIDDLVDACNDALYEYSGNKEGIKKRQVFEDIKYMESVQGWNIPLEHIKEGRKVYYRYSDKDFSINNQPMNDMETEQLKEALLSLSRFKGMPQFEWVSEIAARLYNLNHRDFDKKHIIEFDQNQYLKGLEYITPLYNAILYEKVVNIAYQSFRVDEIQKFVYHPYYLKQYNNRWFVFGISEESAYLTTLSLDRIKSITDTDKAYIKNKEIDFIEYFEDIIGVSKSNDGIVCDITLQVNDVLVPYINTKPIHGSQKVETKSQNESLVFLTLMPNYEFESLLLSYGEGIKVISPEWLSDKMKDRIGQMLDKYN